MELRDGKQIKKGTSCKSNRQRYSVTSKKSGKTRNRCLKTKCTKSKFSGFHFPRPTDGHCNPMQELMPLDKLMDYLLFKKKRTSAQRKKRNLLKKQKQ